jgi:diguanylate cyclase (GGDEF)-like protein/PAS domain S-box-containing protein
MNIKTLLIEDCIEDADLLRRFLSKAEKSGFSVFHTDRLAKGLASLQEQNFDVVLVDLDLPDSHGIETAIAVRKHSAQIPIIILTGFDDEDLASKALQMDVQDYLVKGQIDGSLLKRSIRYAIERKKALAELQYSEARFRAFFESAGVGAVQIDPVTGRFIQINNRFCRITGYYPQELLAMKLSDIVPPDDQEMDKINFARLTGDELSDYEVEKRYVRKDGQVVWVRVSISKIPDTSGRPVRAAGIIQDITARKKAEEHIRHMANHDELTGLPNRRLFYDLINFKMIEARRNKIKFAILFLDLDRFKEINDTLGHEAGDELLKAAGARLRSTIRESDLIARMGGDEFTILLPDMAHGEAVSEVAEKIIGSFRLSFKVSGHEIMITPSIGISIYPDNGMDFDSLLRNADIAMYQAKKQGRNRYLFYTPTIDVPMPERVKLMYPTKSGMA